ncbi:MAG: RNA polymerase factor sigma-54 [Phycisphaeraceae bacterium]|nr:RNA polymerase factor sigma-54 [Phycisphaeraceae bacterium]
MRFDTSQSMRLGQQMKLAPRMIQSMEILQLSAQALEERIEQELENNATLELAGPESEEHAERERSGDDNGTLIQERELDLDNETGADDFERLREMESSYSEAFDNEYSAARATSDDGESRFRERIHQDGERDAKMDAMANTASRTESLGEQLLRQWGLASVDDRTRALGELVIGFIDDDGLVHAGPGEIAAKAPPGEPAPTAEEIEDAILALQRTLEPTGIAARDVRECILLQLDALERDEGESYDTERELIQNHYDDLLRNRLPRIAERSGLAIEQITRAIERMHRLDFAPGRRLAAGELSAVTPDVIVVYDEESDRYIPALNDRMTRSLRINEDYLKMARDKSVEKQTRDFIKTNLRNAQWLLDAVSQRAHTLLRVVNVVCSAQRDFFDEGPEALRPLPMTQVADQLGIHVATVSRAVSGKYIDTPRGVFPLRQFFSGGTQTDSGEEVSWDAVRAKLKELVDNEDKGNPLSDDALAEALKETGVEIARRTVAKYRGQLSIPSARLRRRFGTE